MTGAELLEAAEVVRLALLPGDTLVLKFPMRVSQYDLDAVHQQMKAQFPDPDIKILVLDNGADITVIRPEQAP